MAGEMMKELISFIENFALISGAMIVVGYGVIFALRILRNAARKLKRKSGVVTVIAISLLAVVAIVRGGSKFYFEGVNAIPNASYATNDLVHIEWTWNPDLDGIENENIFIAYRPSYSTNDSDWVLFDGNFFVADRGVNIQHPNATNYSFWIWTEYIPPSPVITNGVYDLYGFDRSELLTNRIISTRIRIGELNTNDNVRIIAPINEGAHQ